MINLSGKKALVTGATGGIGEAIARTLSKLGAEVALSGTRVEKLQELAKELPTKSVILACNLADSADVETLVDKAIEGLGGLDILVNNAGITRDGLAMRMKDEDWKNVIEVDLEAGFRLCRSSIKNMMKQRYGRIINITSIVGVTGNPGQANYCAAKAGLIGMSKSMAQEVASRGITINCVAPGFIRSAMTDALNETQKERILAQIPAARMGDAEEIASAVAFLASDEARYITGQTIHVNGGMAMI